MIVVIDASVTLKTLVEEDDSSIADQVMTSGLTVIAPDVAISEVANALWQKAIRKQISVEQAQAAVLAVPRLYERLVPSGDLVASALTLSLAVNHPIYDMLYVALAKAEKAPFVTSDARLITRLQGHPASALLVALADAPAALNLG